MAAWLEWMEVGMRDVLALKYIWMSAGRISFILLVVIQVLIMVTQTGAIISEILCPQYIRRFKINKLADIILSASLLAVSILDALVICYAGCRFIAIV